ncbi:MAG: glutathione S-transferase [Rhodocyclaceae bacterium]|nr:glutathione S-transferase [Rhodocyclaceae bacterium]
MITVHHLEKSRSQRVLWLLEELALPYTLKVYKRDAKSMLAPPELKAVHPLGKSPVITDGDLTIAESGAILEYLADTYGDHAPAELSPMRPAAGTAEHRQYNYWMHYAEGSLMPSLVMKLIFTIIPTQPMPFFVRPIARQLCSKVQASYVDPGIAAHLSFIDEHLSRNTWFAGERMSLADVQMSFPISAALARGDGAKNFKHMAAYAKRFEARPAYQRALAKGGPVVMG